MTRDPRYYHLTKQLWTEMAEATERCSPEALQEGTRARAALQQLLAKDPAAALQEQPSWVKGGRLSEHQLEGLSFLRRSYAQGHPAVLADAPGLGKGATACAYILTLLREIRSPRPVLLVAPATELQAWQDELTFWAGGGIRTVLYAGSSSARQTILHSEVWLEPRAMDPSPFCPKPVGRGLHLGDMTVPRPQTIKERVPRAHVVIASFEAASRYVHPGILPTALFLLPCCALPTLADGLLLLLRPFPHPYPAGRARSRYTAICNGSPRCHGSRWSWTGPRGCRARPPSSTWTTWPSCRPTTGCS